VGNGRCSGQFLTWEPLITLPLSAPLRIPHLGSPNYQSTFTPTSISHLGTADYSLMSHWGTSNYPLTFLTTSIFTHGPLPLPPHFCHHFQFHTWAIPISHPISPPLLISLLCTSNYPPPFTTTSNFKFPPTCTATSNFTHGHLPLPTHIHI
jgi:hypothetical protein